MTLNWLNDPLLLDAEPTPINKWLTANKLLAKASQKESSNDNNDLVSLEGRWFIHCNDNVCSLNLYSILVRKIDFVRKKDSDRILSRFPFLVLSDEEKVLIKKKILLVAECARDYFYKSINSGIMDWKKRLETYLERGAMPYPLYRCACKVLNLPLLNPKIDELFFESARGKKYSVSTKVTNALAYLCGVCNGDGHLKQHWLRIIDETKEHIVFLSQIFEQLFSDPGEIFKTKDSNAWNVELRCTAAVRLINFLTDHTIDGAKYDSLREPVLFKRLGNPFRNYYWGGAMDADGSYVNHIGFTSVSKTYLKEFQKYLQRIDISSKLIPIKDFGFNLTVPVKHRLDFIHHIGVINSKKAKDYKDFLTRKIVFHKFKGINIKNLTSMGYFNLGLLKSLFIQGVGEYLCKYRDGRPYKRMTEMFNLSAGSFANYERNNRAIPYSLFQKIITNQYEDKDQLFIILSNTKFCVKFQTSNSQPIKLPLKPCETLKQILKFLEPKTSYVNVLTKSEVIQMQIKETFGVGEFNTRIKNRLLVNYLKIFIVYEEVRSYLSSTQFEILQKKWRERITS